MKDCFSLFAYHTDGQPAIFRHPLSKKPGYFIDIEWDERRQYKKSQLKKRRIWIPIHETVIANHKARELYEKFKAAEKIMKEKRKLLRTLFNEMEKMTIANQPRKKDKQLSEY